MVTLCLGTWHLSAIGVIWNNEMTTTTNNNNKSTKVCNTPDMKETDKDTSAVWGGEANCPHVRVLIALDRHLGT